MLDAAVISEEFSGELLLIVEIDDAAHFTDAVSIDHRHAEVDSLDATLASDHGSDGGAAWNAIDVHYFLNGNICHRGDRFQQTVADTIGSEILLAGDVAKDTSIEYRPVALLQLLRVVRVHAMVQVHGPEQALSDSAVIVLWRGLRRNRLENAMRKFLNDVTVATLS